MFLSKVKKISKKLKLTNKKVIHEYILYQTQSDFNVQIMEKTKTTEKKLKNKH